MNREMSAFVFGMIGVSATLAGLFVAVYGANSAAAASLIVSRLPDLLSGSRDWRSWSGGFSANILISFVAMAIGLAGGTVLGIGMIAQSRLVAGVSSLVMNLLRNSPWLVVLYAMLYLLPFEFDLFGRTVTFSPIAKAIIGLALPVSANVAEVINGGIQAIPSGQWESARSLGYRRLQILRHVVIPQAIPLMTPNLMTTYAMLFNGTSLVVVTGTSDVLSVTRTIVATEGERYATGFYLVILFLFFVFSFPIAIATRWLEKRVRVS